MTNQSLKYWFLFCGDQLLLEKETHKIPCSEVPPVTLAENSVFRCGMSEDIPCMTGRVHPVDDPDSLYEMVGLRNCFDLIPADHHLIAGKAHQLQHWNNYSRYCSCCGSPTTLVTEYMKRCDNCHHEIYPTITPAILVLVQKKDSILLVHAHNFKGTFYSLVAGFLETGESLEECVAREVKEETGLSIHNIQYVGSQSWPYPSGVMIGFFADYVEGEITLQTEELSSGRFYTSDELPELPGKLSLARKMIDRWLERRK